MPTMTDPSSPKSFREPQCLHSDRPAAPHRWLWPPRCRLRLAGRARYGDGNCVDALAAHGGPADLIRRWRPSWARCASLTGEERQPGGRRRRLQLGASQRPPCPRPCFPASRAAQAHVRALSATQCFQHCQFLLAHRLSHFEKVLGEPRRATWVSYSNMNPHNNNEI